MTQPRVLHPLKIEEVSPTTLQIEWADGHISKHKYKTLRYYCFCALCRDEWTGRELIRFEDIPDDVYPKEIEPMGTYALRFTWNDGHRTGVYPFEHLRNLCECEACSKPNENGQSE